MNFAVWALIFVVYTAVSCSGLYLLKTGDGVFSIRFVSGAFLYVLGAAIWVFVILKNLPLSFAFPVAAGLLMVGTSTIGIVVLNESVSTYSVLGMISILIGITLISRSI
ncbi:hypothetical protein KIK84_16415 [Curvibacter sp. CHRR-16]|uniref:hypothetical protein n=1 Tax=Curvibacter sp. CHRR-16 TaxID=2835872 RepID=UPI001BDACAB7|nr:hypothetical protein [Curvibacter sp. CHRR-16]MBT0571900.1 hypothetical protein [Curvibacter sp. CHRR-16]